MRVLIYLITLVSGAIAYFAWRGAQERLREEQARKDSVASAKGANNVEDMRSCPKCGAYVPVSGSKPCGQDGCPSGLSLPKSESESHSA